MPSSSPPRILLIAAVASRAFYLLLLLAASSLPLFDASPTAVPVSPSSQPLLRWDAFIFAHIADRGYEYEHQWAFLSGTPFLMRTVACALRIFAPAAVPPSWSILLHAGALTALTCDTTRTLYALTRHYFNAPSIAFLATALSLLPSSPVTLYLASYGEPMYTYLSYRGMLCAARSQWLAAAFFFALAGAFRSNAILLAGFIVWGIAIQPFLDGKKLRPTRVLYAGALAMLVATPFLAHNAAAYAAFCRTPTPAPWCLRRLPFIYAYVQDEYWNVGPFRYWTVAQLPNFALAAPPLLLLSTFAAHHLAHRFRPAAHPAPFLHPALTPHALHAAALVTILVVAAHTQIVLRLAAALPITYWAAAWLLIEHPTAGRWWVAWSATWGAISVVLWAAFLPPA